jgi:molybdopterin synthase catalytic subunit
MNRVLFFAACRERTGMDQTEMDLGGQSVKGARQSILEAHPALKDVLPHCRIAVNQAFADEDLHIEAGDEVALIPPVAGGAPEGGQSAGRVRVLDVPLGVDALLKEVAGPEMGGLVIFVGTVRNHAEGDGVERLEYEAYAAMAEKVIGDILDEVEAQWPEVASAVHHRVGQLAIGDIAVVVATAAPHRKEAFAACQRIIDRLKEDAPIWKREHRSSGLVWVGLGP